MKKLSYLLVLCAGFANADDIGPYIGGGFGYTFNNLSQATNTTTGTASTSPTTQNPYDIRAFAGFQFFSFLGIEAGYNYISSSDSVGNLGSISSTIYDLSLTPGYSLPGIPITIYGRLGIDANATSFNTDWSSQLTNNMNYNFEWGFGVKLDILTSGFFVRADYINYGNNTIINGTNTISTTPSVAMASLGYIF